ADPVMGEVAATFRDWGIPTVESLLACRRALPNGLVIASGGLRTGVDAAKCLALGADATAFAAPVLRAAIAGPGPVVRALRRLTAELRIAVFGAGAARLPVLRAAPRLVRTGGAAGAPGTLGPPVPFPT